MANEFHDYYKILGLEKTASDNEIKKAYRKLARQYHPDINKDETGTQKFRQVSEAYEVLGDPEKRAVYDQYGEDYKEYENWKKAGGEATGVPFEVYRRGPAKAEAQATRSQNGGNYQYRTVNPEEFSEIFGQDSPYSEFFYSMFDRENLGGSRYAASPLKGQNLDAEVQISLEEAFNGTKRVLELPANQPGKTTRRLEVSIPAGIRTAGRVRLAGLGGPGRNGGAAGDLFLIVEVLRHSSFEVKAADLYLKVDAPLSVMLLGGEVSVPTIKGSRQALRIPAESQNGVQIRLRGQGMPVAVNSNERGDMYAQLQVKLPSHLNEAQKAAFEHFAASLTPTQAVGVEGGEN